MRVSLFSVFLLTTGLAVSQQAPVAQSGAAADDEKKFASLEGKLIDDRTGEPIRRANVSLMQIPVGTAGMTMTFPQSTVVASDADSKFIFTRLEPGRYMLSAEKAD
jgi:hypothetical protein